MTRLTEFIAWVWNIWWALKNDSASIGDTFKTSYRINKGTHTQTHMHTPLSGLLGDCPPDSTSIHLCLVVISIPVN